MTYFKRGKFGNKKVEQGGYSFGSQLERAVFNQLKLMELAKEIEVVKTQFSVYLTDARILYIADFLIKTLNDGSFRCVEAKGFETPEWRIKRRLYMHYGPYPLDIYMGSARSFKLKETITPKNPQTGTEPQL